MLIFNLFKIIQDSHFHWFKYNIVDYYTTQDKTSLRSLVSSISHSMLGGKVQKGKKKKITKKEHIHVKTQNILGNTQVPHRLPQSLECGLYICWTTSLNANWF